MLVKDFSFFSLRAFGFVLISSMSLYRGKHMKSVKSAWSVSHSEFQANVLPPYRGIIKDLKRTQTLFL